MRAMAPAKLLVYVKLDSASCCSITALLQLALLFLLSSPYGGVVSTSNERHSDFVSFSTVEELLKTT
jgi:hypothetical protein